MKKLFILLFIFTWINISAQNIGIKLGSTFSTIMADDSSFDNYKTDPLNLGIYIGIFGNINLLHSLNYRPEICFSEYGYKYELDVLNANFPEKYLTQNIGFASHFEYLITNQFSLILGPKIDYILGGKITHSIGNMDSYNINNTIESWELKDRLDYFFNLGFCYKITDLFLIDISYSHGKYHRKYPSEIIDDPDTKLRKQIIQATIGFQF